jgi:hypothetical protein
MHNDNRSSYRDSTVACCNVSDQKQQVIQAMENLQNEPEALIAVRVNNQYTASTRQATAFSSLSCEATIMI